MVRSLGKGGIRPIVVSRDKHDIAFYSRFCGRKIMLSPDGGIDNKAVLDVLIKLGASLGEKAVLYYSNDTELSFIWKYQEQLSRYYTFVLPPGDLMEQLYDKASFALFASANNLPVPPTLILDGPDQLGSVLDAVSYPCIVKPSYHEDWTWDTPEQEKYFGWYKQALRRIDSESQLREFLGMLPERRNRIVIQRYLDGRDDTITSFHGYFDEKSRCLASFMGRKIRTYPPLTGGSVYIRTILNEELRARSIEDLRRIGHRGIVKVDYKWDTVEKDFKILEINTRYNVWQVLGSYAGINFMSIAFDHQTGRPPRAKVPETYPDDIRYLFFKMDLRSWLTGYRKSGDWSFLSYLRSIMHISHYRVLNSADPVPAVVSAIRFFWKNLSRGLRQTWREG